MKIIVPPITRPVRLTDYAPELVREGGEPITVWVWVNPPARMIDEMQALRARSARGGCGLCALTGLPVPHWPVRASMAFSS